MAAWIDERERWLSERRRAPRNAVYARVREDDSSVNRSSEMTGNLAYDLKHAARSLLRSPTFTIVVVLSLALGSGANTALFSLVDQALIRSLPVKKPDELVLLSWQGPFVGRFWGRVSDTDLFTYAQFRDLSSENKDKLQVFQSLCARKPTNLYVSSGGPAEPLPSELISSSCFQLFGVGAALGRVFDQGDDQRAGEHPVIVMSHDYWKNKLGSPPDIVGRKINVNGQSMTVVGVAAAGFRGADPLEAPSVWLPIMMQRQAAPEYAGWLEDPGAKWLHILGRLAPGKSVEQARAALQPWFSGTLENITRHQSWVPIGEQPTQKFLAGRIEVRAAHQGRSDQRLVLQRPLVILLAATAVVLLLACLNVASLFVARAYAKRKELALRSALGASGGRISRDVALQAAILSVVGAGGGIVVAPAISAALLSFLPESVTLIPEINLRVLVFATTVSMATGFLFGVAPAIHVSRVQPAHALREIASSMAGGARLRRALVIGQVALALVLLIAAGLFLRTLAGLRAQVGYAKANMLTFNVDLSKAGYSPLLARQKIVEMLRATRSLPAVDSVGMSRLKLMSGGGYSPRLTIGPGDRVVTEAVNGYMVSPGFFESLGVNFVDGHDFPQSEAEPSAGPEYRFAIVNENFVRRYLPNRNPLAGRLAVGIRPGVATTTQIVGVIRDFQYRGLRKPEVQVFFPALEKPLQSATFFVRTRGPAEATFSSIRGALRQLDPSLPAVVLKTVEAQIDTALATERFLATLATAFAVLAVLLAVMGLYGVMAFMVHRRTREIGIRLAVGAVPFKAVMLIVREAMILAGSGLLIGVPASLALAQFVESQLYGVRSADLPTMALAIVVISLVSVAASSVPAWRASRVQPSIALRTP
jgi:predicted permease